MDKEWATWKLGGTSEQAARWIGVSAEIYREWPEELHPVMADRVYAAILRHEHAGGLGLTPRQYFADPRNEAHLQEMFQRVSIAAVMAHKLKRVPPLYAGRDGPSPDEQLLEAGPGERRKRADKEGEVHAVAG